MRYTVLYRRITINTTKDVLCVFRIEKLGRPSFFSFLLFFEKLFDDFHFLCASDEEWTSLVHLLRHEIEDSSRTRGSLASSLLGQETHWGTLVEQATLTVLVSLVSRVAVDTAVKHGPVKIAHETADVSGRVWLLTVLDKVHVFLETIRPALEIPLVEGVDL